MIGYIFTAVISSIIVYLFCRSEKRILENNAAELARSSDTWQRNFEEMEKNWLDEKERNRELIRQKSSQATKSGNYIETLSPLLEKFPANIFDPNTSVKWLGDPIDFIAFNFEAPEIIFIEIKSGDATLSSRQKIIKKAIKEGLVRFTELRMKSDGTIETD